MEKTMKEVMLTEMKAIETMINEMDGKYKEVLDVLANCKGKVVFMGVGKSGHIGEKLAATFSSTGTPSFFVHSTEACHGDMGMIEERDVAVLISNSGKTKEVVQDLWGLKQIGCKTIAFTSGENSPLANECDYKLIYPKLPEADHLNLAPTVSSTLTLVLGDAIACALSKNKNFTKNDFYKFHPNGALGEQLKGE
ncbi:MAG: SIS domain-containing protein [Clostridiales bacterium]|nr:SIS domain-containing protein [Clostridiales bacterium]